MEKRISDPIYSTSILSREQSAGKNSFSPGPMIDEKDTHQRPMLYRKYHLPDFLTGRIPESLYDSWLNERANTLRQRDIKRKKPYAIVTTKGMYKEKIHAAVLDAGQFDPFTGDMLEWELISSWDSNKAKTGGDDYKDKFLLMPTVDHKDPKANTLEFEIVSWLINDCKSGLDPEQFVDLCGRIVAHREN